MAGVDYDELDAIKSLVEWERTQLVLRGQVDVSAILDTLDRTIRIAREQEKRIEELEDEVEELLTENDRLEEELHSHDED